MATGNLGASLLGLEQFPECAVAFPPSPSSLLAKVVHAHPGAMASVMYPLLLDAPVFLEMCK